MDSYDYPYKIRDLDDEDALTLLAQRVGQLELDVARAEARARDISVSSQVFMFSLSAAALLIALYLAVSPYLGSGRLAPFQVPTVISYISAFAVVYFAYLSHASFHDLVA